MEPSHQINADLSCREFVEQLTDYLERALSPAERARFEHHLAACDGCRDYVDQMLRTIRAVSHHTSGALTDEERARLRAVYHRSKLQ